MNNKKSRVILGCYDLILAAGAIYNGSKMALGVFWGGEFPICAAVTVIVAALLPQIVDCIF